MRLSWKVLCVVAVSALLFAAGCGSDDSDGGSTSSTADSGGSASGDLAAFEAKVEKDVNAAQAQSSERPPTDGPKAQPDKTVFVIGCSFQAEGCARPAKAANEAAKAIGWKSTLVDTGGDPTKAANAIQQAISQKADGVITVGFDSSALQGPLAKARDAGVKTVGTVGTNEDGGFDVAIPGSLEPDGYLIGERAYLQSGKDLKILMFTGDEFGVVRQRITGTEKFVEDCKAAGGKCEILGKQDVIAANLGTQVPSQAAAFARANPGFTIVYAPYDGAATFLIQGLEQSGIDMSKSTMVGFDANAPNLDIIRKDGFEKATLGFPLEWLGWAAVDDMNRLFAGEEPVKLDSLKKLITKENVPESGAWEGDFPGFREAYQETWGK